MIKMEEPTTAELLKDWDGVTKRITQNYRKAKRHETAKSVALGVVVWAALIIIFVGFVTIFHSRP